jgi:predicted transcriptional regulator
MSYASVLHNVEEAAMAAPVSVRLDDDVKETLEAEARARHIGLSTYLRQIAIETATRLRCERIRGQSRAVGDYVAASEEAAAFYDEWGTPQFEDR